MQQNQHISIGRARRGSMAEVLEQQQPMPESLDSKLTTSVAGPVSQSAFEALYFDFCNQSGVLCPRSAMWSRARPGSPSANIHRRVFDDFWKNGSIA